jgi:hypothetical protein
MPARAPRLKQKVKAMLNRKTCLEMIGAGHTVADTARQLGIAVQSVRRLLRQGLASESLYPNNLEPNRIAELRQLEAEKLSTLWQKTHAALDQVQSRLGSEAERNMDATAVARLIEAGTRVSERLAKLFGLDVPMKAQIEMISFNFQKTEKTVTITFDAGALEPPKGPIPGLSVWHNGELVEGPGDATPAFTPNFEPNGHVMIAGASEKRVLDDPSEKST